MGVKDMKVKKDSLGDRMKGRAYIDDLVFPKEED